jgi:D-alanyl-D-alanine carboxypeptidase/D-alanyl-D-alanine-endopeptidase (penicillin-binding protein 4)
MHRTRRLILAVLCCLAAVPGAQAAARLPAALEQALKASGIPADSVAIVVQDVTAERPALSHNAERPMHPASVMKLVTTYAGLEMLGTAYTWNTEAYALGPVRDGTLEGDLLIRGQGDPKLTLENFWLFLRAIRARGIREIRGDLVLDRSYYGFEAGDPGRFDNEPTQVYNTLPDPLLINYKAVRLTFVPDPDHHRVRILTEPALNEVEVVNKLVLDNAACADWRARMRPEVRADASFARLMFSGQMSAQCGEQSRHYSFLSPQIYAGSVFRSLWSELGGRFGGQVREGAAPASARALVIQPSPPLAEIVRDINKFSNNTMARQLFLTLGVAAFGAPATLEKSDRALRLWLAQKQLDLPDLVMENGSGLSRVERISARGLAALLRAAWRSPAMSEFVSSMPVVGVDGTQRRRAHGLPYAGRAHIKGGTIDGVRAMAGYLVDVNARRWIVVCMINHPKAYNGNAHPFFDRVLQWVYNRSAELPPVSEAPEPVQD